GWLRRARLEESLDLTRSDLPPDRDQSHRRFVRSSIWKRRASGMQTYRRGPGPRTQARCSFDMLDVFHRSEWVEQLERAPRSLGNSFHFERLHKLTAHSQFFPQRTI